MKTQIFSQSLIKKTATLIDNGNHNKTTKARHQRRLLKAAERLLQTTPDLEKLKAKTIFKHPRFKPDPVWENKFLNLRLDPIGKPTGWSTFLERKKTKLPIQRCMEGLSVMAPSEELSFCDSPTIIQTTSRVPNHVPRVCSITDSGIAVETKTNVESVEYNTNSVYPLIISVGSDNVRKVASSDPIPEPNGPSLINERAVDWNMVMTLQNTLPKENTVLSVDDVENGLQIHAGNLDDLN
jgi:hypothetical protein